MGSFLNGIFTGSNPTLGGDVNQAGGISSFATGVGEGDISDVSAFDKALLGGNSATEAKLLAPEIETIQKQGQQKIDTTSEFGNRSGGVNASNQTTTDASRANIDNMISQLTGGAASSEASLGTSLLGTGLNANQVQAQESQQRLQNEQQSLLGGAINGGADYLESFLPIAHGG